MPEEDDMLVVVEPGKTMLITTDDDTIDNFGNLCRKDSGIGGPIGPEQQTQPTTLIEEYCSPDCDLGFSNPNWMSVGSKPSTAPPSTKLTIVLSEGITSSDWMDQIDASDAIKHKREEATKTRTSPGFKTTFLHIPTSCGRCDLPDSFLQKHESKRFFFYFTWTKGVPPLKKVLLLQCPPVLTWTLLPYRMRCQSDGRNGASKCNYLSINQVWPTTIRATLRFIVCFPCFFWILVQQWRCPGCN